jgi:hypothetical protein
MNPKLQRFMRYAGRLIPVLVVSYLPGTAMAATSAPRATIARFYAGRTSLWDRLAMSAAPARLALPRETSHQRPLHGETP